VLAKVATFVLALLGGLFGALGALVAIGLVLGSSDASSNSVRLVLACGLSAIAGSVAGIAFASLYLAGRWPRQMAAGLALAAVWHIVSMRIMDISLFGLIGGFLMLIGALFAIARELLGYRAAGTGHAATTGKQA
jgi:hypothetical protein